MRFVSNLVRARYRNQVLFRPASNGNSAGVGRIRINNQALGTGPSGEAETNSAVEKSPA
jgi:hypothetical protein